MLKPELEATRGQWIYVSCTVMVDMGGALYTRITRQCEGCSNTNLRFLHTLEHEETGTQIVVGQDCAIVLLADGDDLPRRAENEVKRKERWRRHYRKPGICRVDVSELDAKGKL